jgi:AbrB family looped-hinge helix DNA binding protein
MQEQRIRIGEGGRVIIPASYRKALGVQPGDELVIRLQNGELRLFQQTKALERLRAALKENKVALSVEDFLASRREDSGA